MSQFRLVFRVHAVQRMFQRGVSEEEVTQVVAVGETIETYPDDKPFPSRLMLGWSSSRPVHVVVAAMLRLRKRLSSPSTNRMRRSGRQTGGGGNADDLCDL